MITTYHLLAKLAETLRPDQATNNKMKIVIIPHIAGSQAIPVNPLYTPLIKTNIIL